MEATRKFLAGALCGALLLPAPEPAYALCAPAGGLVISEVFYDAVGADDSLEWVELYNSSSATIELTGRFSLGWGGSNYLFGTIDLTGSVEPGETFVVGGPQSSSDNAQPSLDQSAVPSLTLQNSGTAADGIALFDIPAAAITAVSVPIDAVIYGPSNSAGLLDPSGSPGSVNVGDAASGQSIERDNAGWNIQPNPTPNISALAPPVDPLILSEVFYDALGDDTNLEWVELFNRGTSTVVLDGNYSLGAGGSDYTFDVHDLAGSIAPGETFLIGGPLSNADNAMPQLDQPQALFLQNGGTTADGVALFRVPAASVTPATIPIDAVIYGESNDNGLLGPDGTPQPPDVNDAAQGESIERVENAWAIMSSPSPGISPLAASGCVVYNDGFETFF